MRRLGVFALLAATPLLAGAHEGSARFTVAAQVTARVSLETLSQPEVLVVSDDDLARGYVEVTATYRVRGNDPLGYLLRFEPRVGLATAVEVSGLASRVVMGAELVEVTQPAALDGRDLELRFRVGLDPGVPAGVYPLPVRVSVSAR